MKGRVKLTPSPLLPPTGKNIFKKPSLIRVKTKKLFPSEDIIEEYSPLHYRTDFTFKKHMLVVKIDEKGHVGKDPDYERKIQK